MGIKLTQSIIYGNETAIYFDPNFIQVLDSHLEYLRKAPNSEIRVIDNRFLGQYYGDFFSVLADMNISAKYHRVIMLLNGLTSSTDFVGQFTDVFIPDLNAIDTILSVYNTGKNKLQLDKPSM